MGPSVGQHPDGALTGCIRLGNLAAGHDRVYLDDPGTGPPTLIAAKATGGLTLNPASGPPGTRIHVSGDLPSGMAPGQPFLPQLPDHELVCWDGCSSGLGEWTVTNWSGSHFEGEVLVPKAPWRSAGRVHAMKPGGYKVQMACVPSTYVKAGCGRIGLEAEFTVTGPAQAARTPWVRITPVQGAPGDLFAVDGWAPIKSLFPQGALDPAPYAYYLSIEPPPVKANPPLADTTLTVVAAPTWAESGNLRPAWTADSGMPAVGGVDGGRRLAECSLAGLRVSEDHGRTWSQVPTAGFTQAVAAIGLVLVGGPHTPVCGSALPDPASRTIYGVASGSPPQGAPPIYPVGVFSRDGGATWHPVPVPSDAPSSFGGFHPTPTGVMAYLSASDHTIVLATSDGGATWAPASLGCPGGGPCALFGAIQTARCQGVASNQFLEVSVDRGATWRLASGVDRLNVCAPIHLAGLPDGRLLLMGVAEHPLQVSGDLGSTWKDIALPPLQGPPGSYPSYGDLQLLPNGTLLAVAGGWNLLRPGATAWCSVNLPVPTSGPARQGGALYWPGGSVGIADLVC